MVIVHPTYFLPLPLYTLYAQTNCLCTLDRKLSPILLIFAQGNFSFGVVQGLWFAKTFSSIEKTLSATPESSSTLQNYIRVCAEAKAIFAY